MPPTSCFRHVNVFIFFLEFSKTYLRFSVEVLVFSIRDISMSSNKGSVDWKQLQQQKPHEIVLSGEKISKQIEEENGLNELIYGINSLNFLEITNTNTLCILSTKIEQLSNLTNLILQGNKLIAIPGMFVLLKFILFNFEVIIFRSNWFTY